MASDSYEIEIKSLLGDKANAEALRERMRACDPQLVYKGAHAQKNHYFVGGDLGALHANVQGAIEPEKQVMLADITARAKDFSVRTRWADGAVLLVLKASVDDAAARSLRSGAANDRREAETSANGTARLEFEAKTPELTLEQLDELLIKSGFAYQAKWSREREDYKFLNANVTIDKNAGYGYLAEFELVLDDASKADEAKARLRAMMADVGLEELPQDRLERMFAHYNAHWPEYYGTDNVFTIA